MEMGVRLVSPNETVSPQMLNEVFISTKGLGKEQQGIISSVPLGPTSPIREWVFPRGPSIS